MAVGTREYLTPEEIDADLLRGILDETEPRHRRILDFVQPDTDNGDEIEMDVIVQQADEAAPLTGFGDRTPFTKGLQIETLKVEPYHIKVGYPFPLKSKHLEVRQNRNIAISTEGLRIAVANLEERRIKRHLAAVLAMMNDKVFSYVGNGLAITVPYSDWIPNLDAPGNGILAGEAELDEPNNANPYKVVELWRDQFEDKTDQAPTLAFINPKTAATFKELPDVKKALAKQQPADPDDMAASYDRFQFGGMTWEVLRHRYKDGDTKKSPVADGKAIFTVPSVDDNAGSLPIIMHKAQNKLNQGNADSPFYEAFQTSKNPPQGGVGGYDNGIPGPARQDIIQHATLWT